MGSAAVGASVTRGVLTVGVKETGVGANVTIAPSAISVLATDVARAQTVFVPATPVAIASGVGVAENNSHASNSTNNIEQVISRTNIRWRMRRLFLWSAGLHKRRSPTQRRMNRKYLPIANRPAVVVGRVLAAFIVLWYNLSWR